MSIFVTGALFFVTGFSALVYQTLWFRQLGLVFGNTIAAATAVISAFMFGMTIGSLLFGRLASGRANPIAWFSLISFFIGISALLVTPMLKGLTAFYIVFARSVPDHGSMLTLVRFAGSFLVLLIPSLLMGGSLPVLVKGIAHNDDGIGGKLGYLYGVNTLGAAIGVFSAGFYFIQTFGISRTNYIAAACNIAVALVGWLQASDRTTGRVEFREHDAGASWSMPLRSWLILTAIFLSGFLALAFELVWFRALILIFGSTTYSFSAMLCIFLLGLGLGSLLLSRLQDRYKDAMFLFGLTELAAAAFTVWSLHRFDLMPEFLLERLISADLSWHALVFSQFTIAVFFLFIPTLCFGVDIPLTASALIKHIPNTPLALGRIYAFNTLGAVLGTIVGGFVLLPKLGMLNSLVLLAVLTAALGLLALSLSHARLRHRMIAVGVAVGLLTINLFPRPIWKKEVLAAGPYFNPMTYIQDGKVVFRTHLDESRLLYFAEGIMATVAVRESDDHHLKYVSDGKVEADTSMRSMTLQKMQGHLPMLFHPMPKHVLNIGLGAGVTFGALNCYPTELLEVVEIEPAAVEVARRFQQFNDDVISNERAKVIINDGRNHLLCTTNVYDVITSDPFEPVHSGAGHLYTVDHFRTARDRLDPDGIMCQYLPLYEMSEKDYLTILYSFLDVFPNSALFYTGDDTILLGFKGKFHLDFDQIVSKWELPHVANSLSTIGFTAPDQILGLFVASFHEGSFTPPQIALNTDDRPIIEFSAPRSALRVTTDANQAALLTFSESIPAELTTTSPERLAYLKRQREALLMALKANVTRADGDTRKSIELLRKAYALSDSNPVIMHRLADVLARQAQHLQHKNLFSQAAVLHREILSYRPREFWSHFQLARFYLNSGEARLSSRHLEALNSNYPDSAIAKALHAYARFKLDDYEKASAMMREAVALRPDKASLWLSYGRLFEQMNNREESAVGYMMYDRLKD